MLCSSLGFFFLQLQRRVFWQNNNCLKFLFQGETQSERKLHSLGQSEEISIVITVLFFFGHHNDVTALLPFTWMTCWLLKQRKFHLKPRSLSSLKKSEDLAVLACFCAEPQLFVLESRLTPFEGQQSPLCHVSTGFILSSWRPNVSCHFPSVCASVCHSTWPSSHVSFAVLALAGSWFSLSTSKP